MIVNLMVLQLLYNLDPAHLRENDIGEDLAVSGHGIVDVVCFIV